MKKKVDSNIKLRFNFKKKFFKRLKDAKNAILNKLHSLNFEWFPFVTPSKLIIQISPTFSRVLGRNNFLFESFFQFSSLIGVNYLVYRLYKNYQEHFVELIRNYNTIQSEESVSLAIYEKEIIYANFLLASYIASEFTHALIDKYFTRRLSHKLQTALDRTIFSNQTFLAISQDPEMKIVIKNLRSDIDTIVEDGGGLLTSAMGCVQNAIISFPYLIQFSQPIRVLGLPDLLVYSICYGSLTNIVTSYFAKQKKIIEDKLKIEQTRLDIISTHTYANIKIITEKHGLPYIQYKQGLIRERIYVLKNRLNFFIALLKALSIFNNFTNGLFRLYIVGKKMFENTILIGDRSEVELSYFYLQTFFSWSEMNADSLKKIETPLKNINAFLIKEEALRRVRRKIVFKEQESNSGNELILTNFSLLTPSRKKLVKIDSIRLKLGERYLVTGASGSGKSTLLSKINKIVGDNFDVSGTITYPKLQNNKFAKLCMISQSNYFHPYDTLLENICFPEVISKRYLPLYREKIIKLLRELKIEANPLQNETESNNELEGLESSIISDLEKENIDWSTRLSGGQTKKIFIISAIIQKPDILILDEVFAGLDKESIQIAQRILLETLPNCLMLSVDHHGRENNYQFQNECFYNGHLNISHQSVNLVSLAKDNDTGRPYDIPGSPRPTGKTLMSRPLERKKYHPGKDNAKSIELESHSKGSDTGGSHDIPTISPMPTSKALLMSRPLEREKRHLGKGNIKPIESEPRSIRKSYYPSFCKIL